MAEEKINEEIDRQKKENGGGQPEPKLPLRRKISIAFADMYGFIKKPKTKGPGAKPATEAKRASAPPPSVFNPQKINLQSINQGLVVALVLLVVSLIYVTFREGRMSTR